MKHMTKTSLAGKSHPGFTLIELMIVVAIVGIVAAIAYPSYIQYVIRSNRSAAESFSLAVANKQEQYILDARQYATSVSALNLTTPSEVSRNYAITITGVTTTPPAYTITATPNSTQSSRDSKCKILTINQAGQKTVSGTGTVADCW